MKRIITLVIAIVCICSVIGCADTKENEKKEQVSVKEEEQEKPEIQKENELEDIVIEEEVHQEKNSTYFDDAVFIGDSRVEGFIQSIGLSNTTSYTHKGLNVSKVFSDEIVNKNGKLVSIMEALKSTPFSKVYIMLGINEMGWVYSDLFIDKYEKIISEIQKINPDAIIYVQSILPVSQKVSETHSYINNKKVLEYNQLLQKMSERKNICYLNVFETMADANGSLPEEAAYDGIHLKKDYCEKWQEYLLTHTEN